MSDSAYQNHLSILRKRFDQALLETDFDGVILASGRLTYYFGDDHSHPFHPYAMAQQWAPFDLMPDVFIHLQRGETPRLLWPAKQDFWHVVHAVPEGGWSDQWRIEPVSSLQEWLPQISGKTAWIGPEYNEAPGLNPNLSVNPEALLHRLNYQRAYKTEFEIDCLWRANQAGAAGHKAAQAAFLAGKSECDVYRDFLAASGQLSNQEPYPGIVALNENAAVLHYEKKNPLKPDAMRTLLIDAGAAYGGYASDITRTYTAASGLFAELIERVNTLQLSIAAQAVHGKAFSELHQATLAGVANILHETRICSLSVEAQLDKRIPQVFFPHGLGHLLGLQVHDVGGHQQDQTGTLRKPDESAPFLRLTRTLEKDMVITIEPGLYFIPMLLDNMVKNISGHSCDLELIETLKPYGGIRIEDNVVVQEGRSRNLTREAFSELLA
ncbi:Xaa-Pro dipeptidase [Hahella sp. KA22]|uniref:Xaa-Pro dipeptidase n=1 Tax=Hahella sp. KA22 TaxID=1628392 RepID=UPI000FDF2EDC|nr:Xaa-Pro dipeptidase [Hahella sp. KA22]AZZ95303.1 Xaa-Pro dipeptidase [Hahella sp. KA22]QAY52948.1 Xaa-Pro dipeptidase [Hahella sp. KA22]